MESQQIVKSESTDYCAHCHRHISLDTWAIHTSYCERNNYYCDECDTTCQKSDITSHNDEFHKSIECECGELVNKLKLA